MKPIKKEHPIQKAELHPRNLHKERYDFALLTKHTPDLAQFVKINPFGDASIDFFNPNAVKMLNKALLKSYYEINDWDIPQAYLCPPIPGRADYIHYIADLLASKNKGIIPKGKQIQCLDVGVGANCVYPILGIQSYHWTFIGADIDAIALESAQKIAQMNPCIADNLSLRLQKNSSNVFQNILQKSEKIDVSICNPPFHASLADAQAGTLRKLNNLKGKKITRPVLNFAGKSNELYCEGGEEKFVHDMIIESKQFAHNCFWFTSLISKEAHLKKIYATFNQIKVSEYQTISMAQGNKISRIVAWTFLSAAEQALWIKERWQ